ncbi:hypothetical protein GW813_04165 [bacterium]|nr:hypothetical protein [bacterium]
MTLLKRTLAALGGLLLCLVVVAGVAVWWNNRAVPAPDEAALVASLERRIAWLDTGAGEILREPNPMLWWMVREAARRTDDSRLSQLFARYEGQYLTHGGNMWAHLFDEGSTAPIRYMEVERLPYYNQYFLYALPCDKLLGAQELIRRQDQPDFCDHGRYRFMPACVTHQLVGLRFLQHRQCGDQAAVRSAIAQLQRKLEGQLTWDVRVVDVYIQRVLMLAESGAAERIKPIWLRRVLDAQMSDGGWSGTRPIVAAGLATPLCFTQSGVAFTVPRSTFHATAQGVLLTSLLLENGH